MGNEELGVRSAEWGMRSGEGVRAENDGGSTKANPLMERTRAFALRILRLCKSLPEGRVEHMIASQLMRCGTSVGANYRAACRARSAAEFRAKPGIVEEEADESIYWMELIAEAGIIPVE